MQEIQYELRLEDVVAWADHHGRNSRHFKKVQRRSHFLWALSYLLLAWISWSALPYSVLSIGFLVGAVLWATLFPSYFRWAYRRNTRKMYSEGHNRALFGPNLIRVDESGLFSKSAHGEEKCAWTAIERVEHSAERVFIYVSSVSARIIPRDTVTAGDIDEFEKAVVGYLAKYG